MNPSQKLAALAEQELPKLLDHVIIEDGKKYRVFGTYVLCPTTQGYRLTQHDDSVGTFSSTRSAVAWCIADKKRQYRLANEIRHLDAALLRLRNDIEVRGSQAQRSYGTFWETVTVKTAQKRAQSQQIENELTKCINSAKYWQLQGSNNETARTGRNTPNKTNRQGI
jgi:hypothetical protein